MVTQDTAVVPQVKKMKKAKKKKSKKKKIRIPESIDNDSEADKVDLEEKVYPLSHYVTDQDELVNQMFLAIRGSKLEAMLPPVLKSIPLKELKKLCLHELRGMSKKRILCCINGEVMEGSSGSDDEEEEKESSEDPKHSEANSKGEKRKPGDDKATESFLNKKIKVEPGLEDAAGGSEGKSVLELLELEMRARIIKTMLEKGDEGKKITEDAIAAVMHSASQVTQEGGEATAGNKEMEKSATESKGDAKDVDSSRDKEENERQRGRRRGHGRGEGRRRHHDRDSSSRSQKRGDGSHGNSGSRSRSSRRPKESNPEKQVVKKKITRKEFEERMKRAKKNRTYRQRKTSEDEEKAEEANDENQTESTKDNKNEKTDEDKTDEKPDTVLEGNGTQDKTGEEGSEKEEGEIDSNEEEEGACSPSDVSSASRFSSSRSSSRSWSRSYSRSVSRSPHRGRQRKSRRSRSRSRNRRRKRRSYSRSYSRSRTPERRWNRNDQQRNTERRSGESPVKKDAKKTSPEDASPSREEDWGHKCDIEFVDSEEDFDDNSDGTKKDSGAQKSLPANRTERASISFSLQKKPVGITQTVDLDDLPLKKKQTMKDDIEAVETTPKPPAKSIEIVISSDSEEETQAPTQKGMTENKTGDAKQSKRQLPVDASGNSIEDRTENTSEPSLQPERKKRFVKKTDDSETKGKDATKTSVSGSTAVMSNLISDLHKDVVTEPQGNDEGKSTQDKSNVETEDRMEEQTIKTIDKSNSNISDDSGDDSNKPEASPDTLTKDTRQHNIPCDDEQDESSQVVITESVDNAKVISDSKDKDSETVSNVEVEDVGNVDSDDAGGQTVAKESCTNTEQTPMEAEKDTEKSVDKDDEWSVESAADDVRDPEAAEANQTMENIRFANIGVEIQGKNDSSCSEAEEKGTLHTSNTSVIADTPKNVERDDGNTCASEDRSDVESGKGTEQAMLRDNEEDDVDMNEPLKGKKTRSNAPKTETRVTRGRSSLSTKFEMVVPTRSLKNRDRKKIEITVGRQTRSSALKSIQSEGVASSSKENEPVAEVSHSMETEGIVAGEETPVVSSALEGDSESSQPVREPEETQECPPTEPEPQPEIPADDDKSSRKTDYGDTEIIGVIETSKDTDDNFDDMELGGGSSWSMRWLQSEKVQKVMTSSKMLSRVRKKIQKKEKATKVVMAEKVEEVQKPAEPVVPVIGSIEEYERLFGTKVNRDDTQSGSQEGVGEGQTTGSSSQAQDNSVESKNKGNPVFGSDDDGEDSEEEALWSKIIKK